MFTQLFFWYVNSPINKTNIFLLSKAVPRLSKYKHIETHHIMIVFLFASADVIIYM